MGPGKKTSKRRYASPKRSAARQATRDKIMKAASVRLRDGGWAEFSIESVARAAGVTRLTVYHQFGDRRGLLESVFDLEAKRGGIGQVAQAMALADPHAALARVVEIFCGFWSSSGSMHGVLAAAMADRELARAIRDRNERRRHILSVLVDRVVERGELHRSRSAQVVDTLFALTSFTFYAELTSARLGSKEACATIAELAAAAIGRDGSPRATKRRK